MPRPSRNNGNISPVDGAWLAGLIDAGRIRWKARGHNRDEGKTTKITYRLMETSEHRIVEAVREAAQVGTVTIEVDWSYKKPNQSVWDLTEEEYYKFLKSVGPYLRYKQDLVAKHLSKRLINPGFGDLDEDKNDS